MELLKELLLEGKKIYSFTYNHLPETKEEWAKWVEQLEKRVKDAEDDDRGPGMGRGTRERLADAREELRRARAQLRKADGTDITKTIKIKDSKKAYEIATAKWKEWNDGSYGPFGWPGRMYKTKDGKELQIPYTKGQKTKSGKSVADFANALEKDLKDI